MPQGLDREQLYSQRVVNAVLRIDRSKFVPEQYRELAENDRALPIGFEQTISQPFIVAFMSQEANVAKGDKVLEIGTGSGYQAAVLAELGAAVYSVEIVPELAKLAQKRLKSLGYSSVHVKHGDGWEGWPSEAPFDSILVTAAAPQVPPELFQQLKEGGRMIIPLKESDSGEILTRVDKVKGKPTKLKLLDVRFVPLTGGPSAVTGGS